MKNLTKFLFAALAFGAVMSSCGDDNGGNDNPTPDPLVLTVDAESILVGESATFTVKQGEVDVTDIALICGTGLNGSCLPANIFVAEVAGEYEFYAYFAKDANVTEGRLESNKVTVTCVDPTAFDPTKEPHKNVAFFVFTSTGCGPCGERKVGIYHPLHDAYPDNMVIVNAYSTSIQGLPAMVPSETAKFEQELSLPSNGFSMYSYPNVITNLRKGEWSDALLFNNPTPATTWAEVAQRAIDKMGTLITQPAKAGILVDSSVSEGNINFSVTIGAHEAGSYSIAALVMEDHVSAVQAGIGYDYDHTDVLRKSTSTSIFGEDMGDFEAGQKMTKEYNIPVDARWNENNLSLTVYVVDNSDKTITNIVKAPVDGFTPFKYEE